MSASHLEQLGRIDSLLEVATRRLPAIVADNDPQGAQAEATIALAYACRGIYDVLTDMLAHMESREDAPPD